MQNKVRAIDKLISARDELEKSGQSFSEAQATLREDPKYIPLWKELDKEIRETTV